jgi:hypothetical protein
MSDQEHQDPINPVQPTGGEGEKERVNGAGESRERSALMNKKLSADRNNNHGNNRQQQPQKQHHHQEHSHEAAEGGRERDGERERDRNQHNKRNRDHHNHNREDDPHNPKPINGMEDPRLRDQSGKLVKIQKNSGGGRNTESFDPESTLVRPDMRIMIGDQNDLLAIKEGRLILKHDDVLVVPEFFCKRDDWAIYNELVNETREIQQRGVRGSEWIRLVSLYLFFV